jgi:hypothetical protein
MPFSTFVELLHRHTLSEKIKGHSESVILSIAVISFIIHLAIIYLVSFGVIDISAESGLLSNPIAAIYTPFSFILLYEVYLLIYYLPKSFTIYIGKQYEIIALIVIRRIFKDLANLTLSNDWFSIKYDLQFTYDIVTTLIMFFLIYLYNKQSKSRVSSLTDIKEDALSRFLIIKKLLAVLLVPVFIGLAVWSFSLWFQSTVFQEKNSVSSFSNINNIFFEQFFNILIFADVIILLFSFYITDKFHVVLRNSGFIISTILIRISFSTTGIVNNLLILCAVVFGLFITLIHNKFEKANAEETAITDKN